MSPSEIIDQIESFREKRAELAADRHEFLVSQGWAFHDSPALRLYRKIDANGIEKKCNTSAAISWEEDWAIKAAEELSCSESDPESER